MPHIAEAWKTIERVLRESVPAVADTLRPGVDDAALAELTRAVGELPDELVASLRIHDGQDNPTRLLDLFDYLTFLSAEAMLDDHRVRGEALGDDLDSDEYSWMTPDRVRTIPNSRGWLRFTDSDGTGHAIDLDPLSAGERGQVIWLPIDGPTPTPIAASYGALLTRLARCLEDGDFTVDEELGVLRLGRDLTT
ncbi:hypothetical protein C5B85_03400 [Pseudoclavibacter sp. AY1F1]|nr:hypothetical protein C5B85_03400 [Pseudoclavibacter sp. AY1F1]